MKAEVKAEAKCGITVRTSPMCIGGSVEAEVWRNGSVRTSAMKAEAESGITVRTSPMCIEDSVGAEIWQNGSVRTSPMCIGGSDQN